MTQHITSEINHNNYFRVFSIFVGILFIGLGLVFIRSWDVLALVGLLMLILSPLLISLGLIKTKEIKNDKKNGAPF